METLPDDCAREVLEVVPLIMRAIRAELRSHRRPDLSLPQFRVLAFLSRHEGASLSDVAEHIGLTLPSMSKAIDGLVRRELVTRQVRPEDRRRVPDISRVRALIGWEAVIPLDESIRAMAEELRSRG